MNTLHVKSGDTVVVLSGKDKGKQGKILSAVASICTGSSDGAEFLNEYLRVTRHGRKAVEHVFWGEV